MTNVQPQQPVYHGQPSPAPRKEGFPTWLIVLIVIGLALVVLGGMCAAIAIPAMTKYMRRAKTSEARIEIAKMFDRVAAYYSENGTCPTDGRANGETGLTPPPSFNCNDHQQGKCNPADYGAQEWSANEVWQKMGYVQDQPHYFHYNFRWGEEPGTCLFTVQAFGDLDDDGIYSTFERAGAADKNGINAAAGLYIDQEVE